MKSQTLKFPTRFPPCRLSAYTIFFITTSLYFLSVLDVYPAISSLYHNAFLLKSLNQSIPAGQDFFISSSRSNSSSSSSSSPVVAGGDGRKPQLNQSVPVSPAIGPPPVLNEEVKIGVAERVKAAAVGFEKCDLFSGEWVGKPEGPYYTNGSCYEIQEHQNCLKFGRPDLGYLMWKWKPDGGCELPEFDPAEFLEIVRGKSMAFIGDSVARNHLQSLVCLLSKVTYPTDRSNWVDQNRQLEYEEYNFNVSLFWSPYLVKTGEVTHNQTRPFDLYLDEFDPQWTSQIANFDYIILSAGHWFFRPTYFHINNRLVGCLYCPDSNVLRRTTTAFSYRRAFRTAFRAINAAKGFSGVVFLRTFAPSHFEGGAWNKGGNCPRTGPYRRNETKMADYTEEMYGIQMEEVGIAGRARRRTGGKWRVRVLDVTKAMQLRADGHPNKYGHRANQSFGNDCVHWCLPGPIDTWNEFLLELLKTENNTTT